MAKAPNFLVIMDDQHRHNLLGCAGAEYTRTPSLDRLAGMGMRFTHNFSPAPICVPARIGLASGLLPFRLGAVDNNSFFPPEIPTYYQRLRDHGYLVGMVGKHDLAKQDYRRGKRGNRPLNYKLGFTDPCETLGKGEGGRYPEPQCPYSNYLADKGLYRHFYQDYLRRAEKNTFQEWVKECAWDSVLEADDFHDSFIGQQAVNWLEQVADEFPWHYFLSFVGPHDPYDPPREFADHFRDARVPFPVYGNESAQPSWLKKKRWEMSEKEVLINRRQNCASIEAIDRQVGRVLDVLERRGMLENTFIFFTSDHGDMLGDHNLWTKAVAYEPSVRVPLIAAGPGIPAGVVNESLVELEDLNPTICELAGLPQQENLDALSLCQTLVNPAVGHRRDVVAFLRNWRMIRTNQYKYIESYNDRPELYDLAADPNETVNRIDANPGLAKDLRQRLLFREEKIRQSADLLA